MGQKVSKGSQPDIISQIQQSVPQHTPDNSTVPMTETAAQMQQQHTEGSTPAKFIKGQPMLKETPPVVITVQNTNQSRLANAKNVYQQFESQIPVTLLEFHEFEGLVKKLVYNRQTVTLKQLQYVLGRKYEDFIDLVEETSLVRRVILSEPFLPDEKSANEESKGECVDVESLMLLGLLYCKDESLQVKAQAWYDILQDTLQEQISANDKDLIVFFKKLALIATHYCHVWSQEWAKKFKEAGGEVIETDKFDQFADKEKVEETIEVVLDEFLDTVFDVSSRVDRKEFVQACIKKYPQLFNSVNLRQIILDKMNE